MKIFTILLLLHITGYAQHNKIERLNGSSVEQTGLSSKIQSLLEAAGVTGIAVTVLNDNDIVYKNAFGYANLDQKDSLTTETVFYGASLSKAVFGYLVATLAQKGIINLDKPLQDYIEIPIPEMQFEKEWKGFTEIRDDKRYENITARMCLSHTTGFPNWRWISQTGEFDPAGKLRFYDDPGSRYSYSGEGMMLLQYIIEHITGKGLEQLAKELVFTPLQMNKTSYVWDERFENNYCNGHTTEQKVIPKDRPESAGAAGSMETTLNDYSKFVQHVLRLAAENSEITTLLFQPNIRIRSKSQFGPASLEQTTENDAISLNYGLGWGLLTSPYGIGAFKEGHGEGFQHYTIIFPEKHLGVILLSNSDNAESIFKELLELTIGDTYTPWKWEAYIPYDHTKN